MVRDLRARLVQGAGIALLASSGLPAVALAAVTVDSVRLWPAPDNTRVVFDLDGPVEHTVFLLKNPERVVVDLRGARLAGKLSRPSREDGLLEQLRAATRNKRDLRVVMDLKRAARPRSFLLKPSKSYGHRLVVDLHVSALPGKAKSSVVKSVDRSRRGLRDVVVAIDAGHGGEDPGAIGRGGTREKDVVLAVSKEVHRQLRRERGIRPVLIREGDYYIGLRRRMEIARERRADLFVSIHADSFRDPRVRGTSVYVLSRNGASSEAARWLAEQENAADLVGGVSLDDKDELLASVLLDLSQTATLSASTEAGSRILDHLKAHGKVHKQRVQRAGFMVLKSPDIPSVLVETAFISNPAEERRLNDARQRRAMARAITDGIRRYFDRNAPPGTLLAARRHKIESGDTLSRIAARYRVSLTQLRQVNNLSSNRIRIGDTLTIPYPEGG